MVASFARNWGLTEGFVTFNQNLSAFTKVKVPAYDKTNNIVKLYDDIYYDNRNGNTVIVMGTASTPALLIDVYQRKGGSSTRYNTPATTSGTSTQAFQQTTDESKISTIPSMVKEWSILTSEKNQLNYLSWGTNTYLTVFDLSNVGLTASAASGDIPAVVPSYQICTASNYSGNVDGVQKTYSIDIPITSSYSYADDATANKDYVEPAYDPSKNLYKFLNNVYYDVANGNLLMNTSTSTTAKSINVYYRTQASGLVSSGSVTPLTDTIQSATAKTATAQSFTNAASDPWFILDSVNNNTIMYWPFGANTILAAFANKNVSGVGIPILKIRRFTNNGIYSDDSGSDKGSGSGETKDTSGNTIDDSLLDAFSRWYIYFNTSAIGSGNSSDYLLKTQIVPPVCPACPACPNAGGSCVNCGGHGGSGTLYGGGSLADVNGPSSGIASLGQSAGSAIQGTTSALGTAALGTGIVAGSVVNNTVDTAGKIVGKTLDTAGNIVGGTVGTAGNIIGGTVGAAGNIIGGTVGAASNLIQSAGSGVTNLLGVNNPNRFGYDQSYRGLNQNNMATSGTYNQGSNVDMYSQYGALPSKGSSNYRPITTDFSSFRK